MKHGSHLQIYNVATIFFPLQLQLPFPVIVRNNFCLL